MRSTASQSKPFLKWAGGKRRLLPILLQHVNRAGDYRAYHEPFLGGGALFFALHGVGLLSGRKAFLSDANRGLIRAYLRVWDDVDGVLRRLRVHERRHSSTYYYRVRSQTPASDTAAAARFIYLNKTCYNGLYRENRQGRFNVPLGRYAHPLICDEATLRAASSALRNTRLSNSGFASALARCKPGDLVYLDPPYHCASSASGFTAYCSGGFGAADHVRLRDECRRLSVLGVRFLLSNSANPFIETLFKEFRIERVIAPRSINRDGRARAR